jgi:hypothetical protein
MPADALCDVALQLENLTRLLNDSRLAIQNRFLFSGYGTEILVRFGSLLCYTPCYTKLCSKWPEGRISAWLEKWVMVPHQPPQRIK